MERGDHGEEQDPQGTQTEEESMDEAGMSDVDTDDDADARTPEAGIDMAGILLDEAGMDEAGMDMDEDDIDGAAMGEVDMDNAGVEEASTDEAGMDRTGTDEASPEEADVGETGNNEDDSAEVEMTEADIVAIFQACAKQNRATNEEPWTRPEFDAFVNGLKSVRGRWGRWDKIYRLHGSSGSLSTALKDRHPMDLRMKAQRTIGWYKWRKRKVPTILRAVAVDDAEIEAAKTDDTRMEEAGKLNVEATVAADIRLYTVTRQTWTRVEIHALLAGLRQFNGRRSKQWTKILGLYGRQGTVSHVLEKYTHRQLREKARKIKDWFLREPGMGNSEVLNILAHLKSSEVTVPRKQMTEAAVQHMATGEKVAA